MGLMMDALKLVLVARVAIKSPNSIVLCVTITNTWAKCRGWLQSGLWTHWSGIQIEIPMMVDLRKHYSHSDKIIIIIIKIVIMKKQASVLELFSSFGALITNTKWSLSLLTQRLLVLRGTFTSFMVSPKEHINMVITLTAEWRSSFSESCEQVFKGHHY